MTLALRPAPKHNTRWSQLGPIAHVPGRSSAVCVCLWILLGPSPTWADVPGADSVTSSPSAAPDAAAPDAAAPDAAASDAAASDAAASDAAAPSVAAQPGWVRPPAPEPPKPAERDEAGFDSEVRAGFSRNYWVVGPAVEYFTSAASNAVSRGSELYGLTAMWRLNAFGPHAMLLSDPSVDRFADSRFLAGLGLRGFVEIPGLTEISYGIGGHVEIRLEDHFWLGYLTPLELGSVIFDKGAWNVELFLGVRRAIAGKLINFYLIDPNGFNSQDAQDDLDAARSSWRAFARLVIGRRID